MIYLSRKLHSKLLIGAESMTKSNKIAVKLESLMVGSPWASSPILRRNRHQGLNQRVVGGRVLSKLGIN